MPYFAIAAYVLFALPAFGLRTAVQYRRTGSTGFRGFSGRQSFVERFAGALFVVASFAAPFGAVLAATGTPALHPLDDEFLRLIGLVLYAAGLAVTLWAQFSMGNSWRIGVDPSERTQLVRHGPFGLVRNPIFSAMIAAFGGLALLVPNLMSLAAFVALVVAIELQVRFAEEPYLLRAHGEEYRNYAAQVGRFLPRIGCLHD